MTARGGTRSGTAGYVDLGLRGPGQGPVVPGNGGVPLGGVGLQSLDVHIAVQKGGGIPKGRVGPVGLHRLVVSPENSAAGNQEAPIVLLHGHTNPRSTSRVMST